jgi:hypothetical protein
LSVPGAPGLALFEIWASRLTHTTSFCQAAPSKPFCLDGACIAACCFNSKNLANGRAGLTTQKYQDRLVRTYLGVVVVVVVLFCVCCGAGVVVVVVESVRFIC